MDKGQSRSDDGGEGEEMKKLLLAFILAAAAAFGQTTAQPLQGVPQQWFDNNGDPCNGCLLYSYTAGTTTPLDTWTTSAGSVANANPVVLDSTGRASVWIKNLSYKFVLKNSTGATTYATYDNVQDAGKILQRDLADTTNDALNSALVGFKAPAGSATTVRAAILDLQSRWVSATDYTGSDIGAKVNAAIADVAGGTVYIPPGTYNFSTAIVLNFPTHLVCGAAGSLTNPICILEFTNTAADAITCEQQSGDGSIILVRICYLDRHVFTRLFA